MNDSRSACPRSSCLLISLAIIAFGYVTGCGGGGSTAPPPTYAIGGTVINLVGTGGGLQLQDDGHDSLLVNANGAFTFPTPLASGTAYSVTVSVQPSAPAQICEVTHGTGTATADVTSVAVDCGHMAWTWVGGSNLTGQVVTYGTEGTPAPGNIPGARGGGAAWIDASGNFWLFGGAGVPPQGTPFGAAPYGYLFNDLWKYSAGEWTWVSGSSQFNQAGAYGTEGTPAPGNIPGARQSSAIWIDASGNLWLFGGAGYDSSGLFFPNFSYLNDFWKYSGGQWTWMGGSNASQGFPGHGGQGTYGTLGTPAPGNIPGGRLCAATWVDKSGNLWLFGGFGYTTAGSVGDPLNDLWKYSAGEWTWMSGSNTPGQAAVYGTQGVPAPGNTPGAEEGVAAWTDASGNLWLFDGALWKYSAGQWTWVGGPQSNTKGVYGILATPAATNIPGARSGAATWTDTAENFWLFGGYGVDSNGAAGNLNDLWKYSAGQWTWMGGSNVVNQNGTYGTLSIPSLASIPGARASGATWVDASGNFWLFGAGGSDSFGPQSQEYNDLWKYEP